MRALPRGGSHYSFKRKLSKIVEMARQISGDSGLDYENAVRALNGLQTPAEERERLRKEKPAKDSLPDHHRAEEKLARTVAYLEHCGMKLTDLNRLNAIHVTGTKGKGSVGAMCESVLRHHGLKTGFFSSPHLLEVRERIRLNGEPLAKDKFVLYFWECYNMLKAAKVEMPMYFKFLTIMSFHVFLQEKTDVAVVEVGIGGAYDCTNIIPRPRVCAISSLGYDHMEVLGETLEKIAWQKGGIFKPGSPAFTAPQFPSAMKVLQERATELKASSLEVAPPFKDYPVGPPQLDPAPLTLGLAGEHQKINASLAAQACWAWLRETGKLDLSTGLANHSNGSREELHRVPLATPFTFTEEFKRGLEQCQWPGRAQVIQKGRVIYYLDGAHTPQSLRACADWFKNECNREDSHCESEKAIRVLLFNITKKREPKLLMQALLDCGFSYAGFSPNVAFPEGSNTADQTNLTVTLDKQMSQSHQNMQAWLDVTSGRTNWLSVLSSSKEKRNGLKTSAPDPASLCSPQDSIHLEFAEDHAKSFSCIRDFLQWCEDICSLRTDSNEAPLSCNGCSSAPVFLRKKKSVENGGQKCEVRVLVTGSLHLVGATMGALGCTVEDL